MDDEMWYKIFAVKFQITQVTVEIHIQFQIKLALTFLKHRHTISGDQNAPK